MKQSNKLLLGGFIAAVLLLVTVQATLYAKFRNKDFIEYAADDEMLSMVMQSFPHVKFVSVRNIRQASIGFGDTAQMEVPNAESVSYVHRGDSLLITGKNNSAGDNRGAEVRLNLPKKVSLHAFNSALTFRSPQNNRGSNSSIHLDASHADFAGERDPLSMDTLGLTATNGSRAEFRNAFIRFLDLSLSHSTLEDLGATFEALTIRSDSTSRISLQAKHFSKAKLNNPSNE